MSFRVPGAETSREPDPTGILSDRVLQGSMLGAFARGTPRHHRRHLLEHTVDDELSILSRHSPERLGTGGKPRDAFGREARRLVDHESLY